MDRIGNIFIEIKTQINYIINDSDFTYSHNYFKCMDEIIAVLRDFTASICIPTLSFDV